MYEILSVEVDAGNSNEFVEALRKLAAMVKPIPHTAVHFIHLVSRVVDEDNDMLELEYSQMTPEDIRNQKDYVKSATERAVSWPGATEVHYPAHEDGVGYIEIRNSNTDPFDASDVEKLLLRVANKISEINPGEVKDLVLHDYINNDALHQPFVRVYYTLRER